MSAHQGPVSESHVIHRTPKVPIRKAVGGDRVYVIDDQGNRYLDACGGAAVCCLGYNDPTVKQAISDQLEALPYVHSGFFTTDVMENLGDRLAALAPGDLNNVYFVSGGSEAVEAALKLARQYFAEIGETNRVRIIAREQSYHGNTLGALAAGGNKMRRQIFNPMLADVYTHIEPCFPYRRMREDETEEEYAIRAADALEAEILRLGPDSVAAFIAETVGGATAGVLVPAPGYFRRIREICDKYGILLILDEVMCGFGRTGTLFACEQDGVVPDLLTVAKGLGGGYQPIGALFASDRVNEAVLNGTGFFQHGHTYIGHAAACAASMAVLDVIERDNLLENVKERGQQLNRLLHENFDNHPYVGNIRGRGLFQGVEIVADRSSKTPFDPAQKVNAKIKKEAMDRGLMCYPGGGTADGLKGDHILLAPAFIIEETEITEIVDRLKAAVDAVAYQAAAGQAAE